MQHTLLYLKAVCAVLLITCAMTTNAQDTIGVYKIDPITVKGVKTVATHKQDQITINLGLIDNTISTTALPDPIAILQLMPGVQTTGEVNSGLYVRGCNTSQNLILLDEAPIYNPSHLMGLFSIFNAAALDQVTLHKSYIAPRYGSRIGGVLEVVSKDRIPLKSSFKGDVGLISSSFAASIKANEKLMINAALRASYVNPIIGLFTVPNSHMALNYDFWDANLSVVYTPTDKDLIKLSTYAGGDYLSVQSPSLVFDGQINWSNRTATIKWEHLSSDSTSRMHALYVSNYDNKIRLNQFTQSFNLPNSVIDYGLKSTWSHKNKGTLIQWGVLGVYHHLTPRTLESESHLLSNMSTPSSSVELNAWGEVTLPLLNTLELTAGAAISTYCAIGSSKFYVNPEPRINLQWSITKKSTLSLSYARMVQYLRQVTVSPSGFPTDFWIASDADIPPLTANAINLNYNLTLKDWAFSASLYFKDIKNEIESTAGLVAMYNQSFNLGDYLHYGTGWNYGLELYAARTTGRFKGWISYTLGFAPRSFANIDKGKVFEAAYNRRHDLSLSLQYNISKNISVSAVFVLASGSAYTPISSIYLMGGITVNDYGVHNSAQLPIYNRLDLALSYRFDTKKLTRSALKLALYNVYGNLNPIMKYDFLKHEEGKLFVDTQYLSLYSFVPTISYTIEF